MIVWNEQFATGLATLDHQHRELINQINKLEKLLYSTNPTLKEVEFILQLIDFLQTYADRHFQHEEGCMERFSCPAHARNQQAHQDFREFFSVYKNQCEKEGFHLDLIRKLHQSASTWVYEHIMRIDTQLRPCIRD